MQQISVVLADDQNIFIDSLSSLLSQQEDLNLNVTFQSVDGSKVLSFLEKNTVHLLILELNLKVIDGFEILTTLKKRKHPVKTLILSRYNSPKMIKQANKLGANGYVLKSCSKDDLLDAIHAILKGQEIWGNDIQAFASQNTNSKGAKNFDAPIDDKFAKKHSLTKREIQILELIIQAMNNKQIAKKLFISDQTVSVHRKNIMRKLGVSNTAGLIRAAYENFIVK